MRMAPSIPTSEPATLSAGASWQWSRALPEFPVSEGWAAKYFLTGKTSLSFSTTPNATTGRYDVAVLPSVTKDVAAGVYRWILRVSLVFAVPQVSPVYDVVPQGTFDVLANPDVTAASDQRTYAEQMLARVEAELLVRVPGTGAGVNQYSIGSREFQKFTLDELTTLRNKLAAEVAAQRYGKLPDVEAYFVRA